MRLAARDPRRTRPPAWLRGAVVAAAFGALLALELRRPLRAATSPKLRRNARNLAVAALAGATTALVERPVVDRLARAVVRRRIGLLQRVALPPAAEVACAVVLMDYTLYLWHVLTHRVAWLWRFHRPHHADLDLDASTAVRFHFAELALAVGWRAAQVLAIGVSPRALAVWQTALLASILFHHSNVRLPERLERALALAVVTPRLHGIHHSTARDEVDSNWSSGLTLWDRLHGTLRTDVPQSRIAIGVPEHRDPRGLTLGAVLAMPFVAQRGAR